MTPNSFKQKKLKSWEEDVRKKKKTDKISLDFSDLLSTSWKSLKESEKSNVRAFTVSIGDPVKWDSNPGTLGLISDVANKQNQKSLPHT